MLQVNTNMEQLNIDFGDYGDIGNQLSIIEWLNQNDEENLRLQYMQEQADISENEEIIAMLEEQLLAGTIFEEEDFDGED